MLPQRALSGQSHGLALMATTVANDGVSFVYGDPYNSNSTWNAAGNYDYTVYDQGLTDTQIQVGLPAGVLSCRCQRAPSVGRWQHEHPGAHARSNHRADRLPHVPAEHCRACLRYALHARHLSLLAHKTRPAAPTFSPTFAPTGRPTLSPTDFILIPVPTVAPSPAPTVSPLQAGLFAQYWAYPRRILLPTDYCALGAAADTRIISRVNDASLQGISLTTNFAARFIGFLVIPTAGQWWFSLTSDDGARVYLNNTLILDNDGTQHLATAAVSIGPLTLPAGRLPLRVEYFQFLALTSISLNWAAVGIPNQNIPASAFVYDSTNGTVPVCPPSPAPTAVPTGEPSLAPTAEPTEATGAPSAAPTVVPTVRTPRLTYHGGPIVSYPQVQVVFWSSAVNLKVLARSLRGARGPRSQTPCLTH